MDKIIQHFKNSQDILKIFSLNSNTGIFTYKIKTNRNIVIGQKAGTPDKDGYIKLHINHKQYMSHRLAFYCYHNYLPDKPLIIEHVDGNKQNNSINNLRIATQQQNIANKNLTLIRNIKAFIIIKMLTKINIIRKLNAETNATI